MHRAPVHMRHEDRGWPEAPVSRKGNMKVHSAAAPLDLLF